MQLPSSLHFRLFIVTLERFDDVSYKRYIYLFFDYRYRGITVDSDTVTAVLLSALSLPMITAVFILTKTPIPPIYSGIRGTTVNAVPLKASSTRTLCSRLNSLIRKYLFRKSDVILSISCYCYYSSRHVIAIRITRRINGRMAIASNIWESSRISLTTLYDQCSKI